MKNKKRLLIGTLSCLMIFSNMNFVHATNSSTGRNLKQRSLDVVENMPNIPSHYKIIDWKKRGKDLNDFVFDYTATNFNEKTEFSVKEGRTFSTIYRDDKYGGYMIPAFYGENRPLRENGEDDQESISVTSALIAASLLGIDMNKELPDELKGTNTVSGGYEINTYLDNALKFFWNGQKGNVFTNVPNGSESKLQNMADVSNAYGDFWYLLIANQNFYRLADLNPNWKPEEILRLQETVADQMIAMVDILDQTEDKFKIQCFDFEHMKPLERVEGHRYWTQPDAAVGTGCILYYSYKIFKDKEPEKATKYLNYAKYCMDYLQNLNENPYYENMLIDAVYLAAMMNAEVGTNYDVSKFWNWITSMSGSSVRNWGGVNYTQDGIDIYGMTGEPGYSYFFNSIYPMTSILPAAKYDPSYARMAGKWAINIANASKYFLPSEWNEEHQTDGEYIGKTEENVMAYESLRKNSNGKNFYATGDAKQNATSGWMAGENTTNFGLYGGFYTGFLGALVDETNVEGILKLDCNKTDYYQDDMYDTYLYYNPYMESKDVEIDLGQQSYDLYDSVTGTYLAKNVTGKQTFKMLADSARVIVLADPNSSVEYNQNTTKINQKLVAHSTAEVLPNQGTELIQNVSIEGLIEITQRGQIAQYTTLLTPNTNIMDPRIIWSVTDIHGMETDKAVISDDGYVTAKKNGQIKVVAKTIDGSGEIGEKIVTISGQTLASLSQDKSVMTSSVGDNHSGSLAVDGDETSRWIANPGEEHPWIYVDLAAKADINSIVINWEAARPPKYVVQVSDDASQWTEIAKIEDEGNSNKIVRLTFDEVKSGRYVRIYTNEKSRYGCSLYEFDVYGNYQIAQEVSSIAVTSENNVHKISTKNRPLQMYAEIVPVNATDKRVEWFVFNENGQETDIAEITSSGKLIPLKNGNVKVIAKAVDGSHVQGEMNITIENQDKENLAFQKQGYASNQEGANPIQDAFDGKTETRWASGKQDDNQWITVDLGDVYNVNKVVLYWESFPSEYKIQGSIDNKDFTDLYVEDAGQGGIEEKIFDAKPARYVRMQCIKRSGQYGNSLWEFQVYGDKYEKTYVENIALSTETGKPEILIKNKPLQLKATVTPDHATISAVNWFVYNEDGSDTNLAIITKEGQLIPKQNGTVKVVAKATDGSQKQAELIITIKGQEALNIALQKSATATSQTDSNDAKKAVDGKTNTRWAAQNNDDESITIDLGQLHYAHHVSILWEAAYAKEYKIQGSIDGQNYFDIHHETNGKGDLENIDFDETLVRYMRMQGVKRSIGYGYSIYELEIYGKQMKEDLNVLYQTIKDTDETLYTPKSYKGLNDALKLAKQVLGNSDATENMVKETTQKLQNAYNQLLLRANKTLLKEELNKANIIDKSLYTPNSLEEYNKIFNQAQDVFNDQNTTQKEVDETKELLENSVKLLVKKADKKELQKLLTQANQLNKTLYTQETYALVEERKVQAQKVYDNQNATGKQVQDTYQNLKAAMDKLVKKAVIHPEEPEKTITITGHNQTVMVTGKLPKDIELSVEQLSQEELDKIIEDIKKLNANFFKNATIEKVLDLELYLKGEKYSLEEGVNVIFKIDENLKDKQLGVIYIGENGNIEKIEAVRDGDYMNILATHFSRYAIVSYAKEDENIAQQGKVEIPGTEDTTVVCAFVGLTLLSVAGVYLSLRKRKEQ